MLTLLTCALLPACHEEHASVDASGDVEVADVLVDAPVDAPDLDALAAEQRAGRLGAARAAFDAGTYDGGELYAAAVRTSVVSVPEWPEGDAGTNSTRLGYLRHGSHAPAFAEPIVNDDCPEGWYELIEGGFVCGKYVSTDLEQRGGEVRGEPAQHRRRHAVPLRLRRRQRHAGLQARAVALGSQEVRAVVGPAGGGWRPRRRPRARSASRRSATRATTPTRTRPRRTRSASATPAPTP